MLEFIVRDSGMGISKDQVDSLFKLFRKQEDDTGFGLGLTLCKHICQALGGDLKIESRLNEGTKVRFSIRPEKINLKSFINYDEDDTGDSEIRESWKYRQRVDRSIVF